jgi:hypothetical protein
MAQVVSCWPLTGETGVSACGFVVDKVALGQVFLHVLQFPMSISFHHGSPYSYITWGINNRPRLCGDQTPAALSSSL